MTFSSAISSHRCRRTVWVLMIDEHIPSGPDAIIRCSTGIELRHDERMKATLSRPAPDARTRPRAADGAIAGAAGPRRPGRAYRCMLPVAPAGRQGDPAQEPEPDLLPDQRRRPRGGARRGRPDAQAGVRLVLSRTTATARSASQLGMTPLEMLLARGRREGRPELRRPPDAVALGPQGAQHRLAVEPDRHAVPAGGRRRRGRRPLQPRHRRSPTARRGSTPTRSSTSRSATARRAKASSGNR